MSQRWQLAQVNVARPREPVTSPVLKDFMDLLDPINALADRSPGFVWRLQTEDGNATSIAFDEGILVNMSVWDSVETLGAFVYETAHLPVLRRRKEWFHRMAEAYLALWWIPIGTIPSIDDARGRLAHVRGHGPTPYAFTLKQHFPSPSERDETAISDDRWPCPVG